MAPQTWLEQIAHITDINKHNLYFNDINLVNMVILLIISTNKYNLVFKLLVNIYKCLHLLFSHPDKDPVFP